MQVPTLLLWRGEAKGYGNSTHHTQEAEWAVNSAGPGYTGLPQEKEGGKGGEDLVLVLTAPAGIQPSALSFLRKLTLLSHR